MADFTVITVSKRSVASFSLREAAVLSGMHPQMILEFVRAGYVPLLGYEETGNPIFGEDGVLRLREIEELRSWHGIGLRAIRYIVHLLDRLESAEQEVRRLREQLR